MTRFQWGTCWVPLLMFVCGVCAQEKSHTPIRIAVVEALKDVATAWQENSGLDLQFEAVDFNVALRKVTGEKADFALFAGSLTPGQRALLTSTPGTMALSHRIGWEALSFLVHPSNPISSISLPTAQALFAASGCIQGTSPLRAWGDLAGCTGTIRSTSIEVLLPRPGSLEEEALKQLLLDGCQLRTDCQILTSDAAVERCVATHPGAIGAVSRLRFIPHGRVVSVTSTSPFPVGRESIIVPQTRLQRMGKISRSFEGLSHGGMGRNGFLKSHPLAREINLASRRRFPQGSPQQALVQYALSEAGQADLARLGLYPLREE